MDDSKAKAEQAPKGGKRYSAPVLTEYGSVAKLTMAKGGSFLEPPASKKSTQCL